MTSPDRSKGDRSRDEVLAGEYVLGVLSADDRRKVEARMLRDRDFAAIVNRWQDNLSTFTADDGTERPPSWFYSRIEAHLHGAAGKGRVSGARAGLWNSLMLWRAVAFASLAMAVGFGLENAGLFAPAPGGRQLVAQLSGENNAINLLVRYDGRTGLLRVTPMAAGKPDEKSLQLWLMKGGDPPRSLGILPQTGEGELTIPANMRPLVGEGAVLAVSLEPRGGSPTGKATAPMIALGPAHMQ